MAQALLRSHVPAPPMAEYDSAMGVTPGLVTFAEFEQMPETDVPVKEEPPGWRITPNALEFVRHKRMVHRMHRLMCPMRDAPNRTANLGEAYRETGTSGWRSDPLSAAEIRSYVNGRSSLRYSKAGACRPESIVSAWPRLCRNGLQNRRDRVATARCERLASGLKTRFSRVWRSCNI